MANDINTAIAAVETALGNITTDGGYNYDLGSDEFIGMESQDQVLGGRPRVYIVNASDDVERFSSSKLYKIVTVTIRGITEAEQYRGLRNNVALLWADIETAMYSDKTLGGTVTTLRYVGGSVDFNRQTNHGTLEMRFELDLHYTEGSP